MQPFATVQQLEDFWRPLSSDEQTRAASLLELSSNRLRLKARGLNVDLDAEAEDEVFASVLQSVVLESVKRAMQAPQALQDSPAVSQWSQTAGPYSENYRFVNPTGDLWFKKAELKSLGLGSQRIWNVSTTKRDIYGEDDIV